LSEQRSRLAGIKIRKGKEEEELSEANKHQSTKAPTRGAARFQNTERTTFLYFFFLTGRRKKSTDRKKFRAECKVKMSQPVPGGVYILAPLRKSQHTSQTSSSSLPARSSTLAPKPDISAFGSGPSRQQSRDYALERASESDVPPLASHHDNENEEDLEELHEHDDQFVVVRHKRERLLPHLRADLLTLAIPSCLVSGKHVIETAFFFVLAHTPSRNHFSDFFFAFRLCLRSCVFGLPNTRYQKPKAHQARIMVVLTISFPPTLTFPFL
jgi:hypothetical protein